MRDLIEVISYKDTANAHSHSHTQIVLPLSGHLILDVENRQQAVQFGQACMISSNQTHTHLARENNHCLILNSLPVWDSQIESKNNFVELNAQTKAYLPFLSSLIGESHNPLKTQQALNLLEHLLPIPQTKILQSDTRLAKAKHRLDHNFQEHWSLAELACDVHLSPSQLTVLFKRHLKMTPKQYLQQRRLTEAKMWLRSTNKSLEYIAQKVGVSDASALVRLFSKYYLITPGNYRTNHTSRKT
ncbi:transcriptional regulator, AraC family [Marinomonas polaris DSM 16579]|uniref:Transcriptional regulator, AraC family n=1 Tax=Marinomonas polaris DSM 16579 TaxID=1122206 RepID=A0A1M5JZW8_9GAMM|nr:AraC family transcriptional regulator [Marinomonas polaris]SHG46096.1 transcriptional regulator, AraC family [Marinomonas polaris DSM 16579]